ncbi:MAG: hypothetical protein ABL966_13080 [Acidimicrobiales bacterium]
MSLVDATYPVRLGFVPPSVAIPDPDHPGLLRAGPRASAPYGKSNVEVHVCDATDCGAGTVQPDLKTFGFDTVDLSALDALQEACAGVRAAGAVASDQAGEIRAALDGSVLPTSNGGSLRVMHIAAEGFIMRTAGPNGLSMVGPRSSSMNGHSQATSVHADQDVFGTPMAQLMDGRAPELFIHDSPDGHNHDAELLLVNLWIPLQQITQPLVLADGRSIDRRRHQLRYGLATDSFLERDDDLVINDIWSFLHGSDQRWYFRSEMDHRSAHVFNTLSTAHGAGTLPGEDTAERGYRMLEAAESAVVAGDAAALTSTLSDAAELHRPQPTTPALAGAIETMLTLIDDATTAPSAVCGERAEAWVTASRSARRQVVRMSLELRMVVSIVG